MNITVRQTVLLMCIILASLLFFMDVVLKTNGTYAIWAELESNQKEPRVGDVTETAYNVNDKENTEIVRDKKKNATDIKGFIKLQTQRVADEADRVQKMYEKLLGCRKLPDILTIGFEKCGTATLDKYLGIHPQIFKAEDGNYELFNKKSDVNVLEYTRHARCTPPGMMRLQKLATPGTAEKTYEVIPNAKLLAIVREPAERAMSQYMMNLDKGLLDSKQSTFDDLISSIMYYNEPYSLKTSALFSRSRFIEKLEPWIAKYGLDNIHIVNGDAFAKYPVDELQKVERFLDIKPFITRDQFVYDEHKRFYCLKDGNNAKCMPSRKGRPHPQMSYETRKRLQAYFKPFNEKLFKTIGRNFSWNY